MENEKIEIKIEIGVLPKTTMELSITKGGKEVEGGDITVRELISMYSGVIVLKDILERNAMQNGMDFASALAKKDRKGVLDKMLDWVNGN